MAQPESRAVVAPQGSPRPPPPVTCSTRIGVSSKSTPLTWRPSDQDLQRADRSVRIVLTGSKNGACIKEVFQRFPLRILFPSTVAGGVEEAVPVNTAAVSSNSAP